MAPGLLSHETELTFYHLNEVKNKDFPTLEINKKTINVSKRKKKEGPIGWSPA